MYKYREGQVDSGVQIIDKNCNAEERCIPMVYGINIINVTNLTFVSTQYLIFSPRHPRFNLMLHYCSKYPGNRTVLDSGMKRTAFSFGKYYG